MAFKKREAKEIRADSPRALFRDLRNRSVHGLLDHQGEMLDVYYENAFDDKDVALEMPTGSGKTLVGLLIAEYRRVSLNERVVYLCPTRQLVHQVAEQSKKKYGIRTCAFVGPKVEFSPSDRSLYMAGKAIAVTTYSGLFNSNPFFNDPDLIVLDDAHAAESYIAGTWSLEVNRFENSEFFDSLVGVLQNYIHESQYNMLTSIDPLSYEQLQWVDMLPFPEQVKAIEKLTNVIDSFVENTNLGYAWARIRHNLHACNLYFSPRQILIRPIIPPTKSHIPFSGAKQRVYMSATLGLSGELERIMGVEQIKRLPMVQGWDKQGMGRRLLFFPEASLTKEESMECVCEMMKLAGRSLVLVPDDRSVGEFESTIAKMTDIEIFTKEDLEISKQTFVNSYNSAALLANRFDGMDFADNDCRLLIISGLPRATHLQEQFMSSRMSASVLLNERIRTRMIQAIGRCTRSSIDYAAVIILGVELQDELVSHMKIKGYHPELQAEIQFGFDQSMDVKKGDFLDNLDIFLAQKEEWDEAEKEILSERDKRTLETPDYFKSLLESARYEVKYLYALWKNDPLEALSCAENVISRLAGGESLRGYRGFWNYLAGNSALLAVQQGHIEYESKWRDSYIRAAACTDSVTWFKQVLAKNRTIDEGNRVLDDSIIFQIERLEGLIEQLGTTNNRRFENEAKSIVDLLNSIDGKNFEIGVEQLGKWMGFVSNNTDEDAGPDPWWINGDELCFVTECKIYQDPEKAIPTCDVRQAQLHSKWIREKEKGIRTDAKIITLFVTNTSTIEHSAVTFADGIYYVNQNQLYELAQKMISALRTLRSSFSGRGDITWRKAARELLEKNKLTVIDMVNSLERVGLESITSK